MNASVKSIEDKNNEYKKIIEKNDGKSFHDILAARESEDPGVNDREYRNALIIGKHDTNAFMSKVTNHTHPDHANALSVFKDRYGNNRAKAEADFNDKAVKMMGATRNYKQNTAYENKVLSSFKISTADEQGLYNKFKEYMRNKWKAIGYADDVDYINNFLDVHPMLQLKNKNIELPVPEHR
ncbi:hypothetical protein FW778_06225 [Ginsengibacter hankyongi]|uniref:Uncharacterized protein n=1 Tax=Ginsengibacter hankyongi TaxID=2607284 RepID=A0A5J5INV3_9BACT|nr:hypothetical protein [Ginsengibacter hankyongi]KAA9041614.1 hypothetical protein FW778_06225 [Ginsengibacter hankyongi]